MNKSYLRIPKILENDVSHFDLTDAYFAIIINALQIINIPSNVKKFFIHSFMHGRYLRELHMIIMLNLFKY